MPPCIDQIHEAFDQDDPKRRVALARKALKISPECADAYSLLAEETAETAEEKLKLYALGVTAGQDRETQAIMLALVKPPFSGKYIWQVLGQPYGHGVFMSS